MGTSIKSNANAGRISELGIIEGIKGDFVTKDLVAHTRSFVSVLALSLVQAVGGAGGALAATPQNGSAVERSSVPAPLKEVTDILERVVVIGASVSDGYRAYIESEDVAVAPGWIKHSPCGQKKLADLLDLVIVAEHEQVMNEADTHLFSDPIRKGKKMIQKALERKPTLVIATDFLFWFAFGKNGADLESGLRLLEHFKCPVVIGNIPDLSQSGSFNRSEEAPAFFKKTPGINEHIKKWAHSRSNVTVLDLDEINKANREGKFIKVGDVELMLDPKISLFQEDGLHLTAEGEATLASFVMAKVGQTQSEIQSNSLMTDPRRVIEEMRRICKEKMAKMPTVGDRKNRP